ncbi:kinase-like domain-containing protein [Ilyonectria sp. MPI-CAGE-AT-0026]|nr:kinase-like domain-containing protein [Ilyonectria sp. MPI-CAGE-AT-0026]
MSSTETETVQLIRRCFAEEEENPPVPQTADDVPVSYQAMTPEWLTLVLGPYSGGARVKSFSLGPKDNGTSNRRRVYLEWEGNSTKTPPDSVFCKAAHALNNRITLFNGGTKSESWASIIMLRDMDQRTKFCTHRTILSKEQLGQQLLILAKLHGNFYQSTKDVFGQVTTLKGRFNRLIVTVDFKGAAESGFKAAKSVIPLHVFAREDAVWERTLQSLERCASLPPTLIHGDVHLGNWYMTADGNMGLTDWAVLSRGHWSRDVAYVLATAVSLEKRREWEHEMVQFYLEELAKAGGPSVSAAEAWLELRRASFLALAYWTVTLTPSSSMPDMQPEDTTLEFIRRITTFMGDHQVFDSFADM